MTKVGGQALLEAVARHDFDLCVTVCKLAKSFDIFYGDGPITPTVGLKSLQRGVHLFPRNIGHDSKFCLRQAIHTGNAVTLAGFSRADIVRYLAFVNRIIGNLSRMSE